MDHSTAIITNHHEDYSFGHLPPMATLPDELLRQPRNLITVELFSSPNLFTAGIHIPRVPLHNQGYPRFALFCEIFLMPAIPLPEYRR
jgi:hypothetical protein